MTAPEAPPAPASDGSNVVPQHFNIVALETVLSGLPTITVPAPHTFSLTTYDRTAPADVGARLRDADIAIITTVPIRGEALDVSVTPNLKLISAIASGTDTIDLAACAARGIRVLNSPGCNIDAVAEHAVGLYFAARRNVVPSMRALQQGTWPQRGTLMRTAMTHGEPVRGCRAETVALIGHGAVGKRVAELLRVLGMTVLVAGRKGAEGADVPEGRVPFAEALRKATVVVLCCPRTPETMNLLSTAEFAAMPRDSVLVNVSRGGIVDEAALLAALQEGQIGGAGVDVFATEPASAATSPLLTPEAADLNLVVTPHTAWIAAQTTANNYRVLVENIHGFISGDMAPERIRA